MRVAVLVSALLGLAAPALAPPSAQAGSICLVVAEVASGLIIHRDGDCAVRRYPMSTFKIPLALMGFDAGVLVDPENPRLDYRPEFKRSEREQKPTDPTIWLRDSIVWYSQELTRKLGTERFQRYVDAFDYGNHDLAGGPGDIDGLTGAWLMSSLEISPDEQVQFLRKLVRRELPATARAFDMTERSMPVFEAAGDWTVHGKTGSGWLRDGKGEIDRGHPLGWFVGWAEKDGRKVVFARNAVLDGANDTPASYIVRDALLMELAKAATR